MNGAGVARVTIPRGGSLDQAGRFVERNRTWIARQVARLPGEWRNGTLVLLRGLETPLEITGSFVRLGPYQLGSCAGDARALVEGALRQIAEPELIEATLVWARSLGFSLRKVRVGNQRTRWGSCSSKGAISLNWRLIQTPEFVRDYIIVHELMHLREMNHSARFWSHVAAAFPRYEEAELWLRKNAALLR